MRVTVKAVSSIRYWLLMTMTAVLSLPTAAENQSTLRLPAKSELLVLDGQAANELDLARGKPIVLSRTRRHQIVFELSDTIGSGNNIERFTSHPFILTFHPVSGQKYTIMAPRLINQRQANAINNNPASKITLVNGKGEEVAHELAVLPSRGLQLGRNYTKEVRKFNLTENEAAVHEFSGMEVAATEQTKTLVNSEDNTDEENIMAEKMLKYWFNAASNDTRKAFLNWAGEEMEK